MGVILLYQLAMHDEQMSKLPCVSFFSCVNTILVYLQSLVILQMKYR